MSTAGQPILCLTTKLLDSCFMLMCSAIRINSKAFMLQWYVCQVPMGELSSSGGSWKAKAHLIRWGTVRMSLI